jgi:hypothetical protein
MASLKAVLFDWFSEMFSARGMEIILIRSVGTPIVNLAVKCMISCWLMVVIMNFKLEGGCM